MLEEFDKQVSVFTESLARRLARRKMLGTAVKGAVAAIAAATIGQFTNLRQAFAVSCTCDDNWTNGVPCDNIGHSCPSSGCPSGCSVCCCNDCNGWCNYPSGSWTSCSGLGKCGNGYKICTDCKCGNPCTKQNRCTCLSQCICCNCCTKADVQAEMRRLAASSA